MKVRGNSEPRTTDQAKTKIELLIDRLKDPDQATFLLVAYPEFTPIHESYRAMKDLERVGIKAQGVLLNHILDQKDCQSGFALERWKLQQHYLYQAQDLYQPIPLFAIPLKPSEIIGIKKIKELSDDIFRNNN